MPVINRIAEFEPELRAWRRHLHTIPELDFDLHETAAFVEARLKEIGVDEIHTGIAKTGIVALIRGQGDGPAIGLRADMDALPIEEATGVDYASKYPGRMHACGHDGHTAILLGAARYLAETRNFAGTAALIFQPSEEMSGGGQVMCQEGIMDRFAIAKVFSIHNAPDIDFGRIHVRPGPMLAAADEFRITIKGKGGHAAMPHMAVDPVPALLQLGQALQAIPARRLSPLASAVVSLTMLRAGEVTNVIPEEVMLAGTVRSLDPEVRERMERDIRDAAQACAAAHRCQAEIAYVRGYPVTMNDVAETDFAAEVAEEVVGAERVNAACDPELGSEDFSYMLEERPGAYVMLGTGPGAQCHNPEFNYNDDATPIGASWFVRLVERALPLSR
ncbi:MAG: M20 family metallopeptidase [Paracoccaceae bacterium]|nr:M20 family metallopeptidase [Paracoccaceae bacterium]